MKVKVSHTPSERDWWRLYWLFIKHSVFALKWCVHNSSSGFNGLNVLGCKWPAIIRRRHATVQPSVQPSVHPTGRLLNTASCLLQRQLQLAVARSNSSAVVISIQSWTMLKTGARHRNCQRPSASVVGLQDSCLELSPCRYKIHV